MTVAFVRKAQALPGKEFEAVMWGKKIAELSAKITGTEVTVRNESAGLSEPLRGSLTTPI